MSDGDLLELVPEALRGSEVERRYWLGVLKGPARIQAYLDARAQILRDHAYDPDELPDEVIPYLAASVGLGPDLPVVAELTVDELRRLTAIAVAMWKRKGSTDSWRAALLHLGPARAMILDWFYLRIVEGTSGELVLLPDPGTAPGGNYDYPETVSDVWVEDPDEALDLERLGRFLNLLRPTNERINLYRALFVEDLRQSTLLWSIDDPPNGYHDPDRKALVSEDGALFLANPDDAPDLSGANGYHVFLRLAMTGGADLWVAADADASDGYRLRWTAGDPAGSLEVSRVVAGVATSLGTFASPAIVDGYRYRWSVDVRRGTGVTELQVRQEETLVATVLDTNAARHFTGRWGWAGGPGGSDSALVDAVLVWELGVSPVRVGPA